MESTQINTESKHSISTNSTDNLVLFPSLSDQGERWLVGNTHLRRLWILPVTGLGIQSIWNRSLDPWTASWWLLGI